MREIMRIEPEETEDILNDALEIMKSLNADYEGIELLKEKVRFLKTFGLSAEIIIYEDMSVEIVIPKTTEKPN